MKNKTVWKVFCLLFICLACLFSVRGSGQAEEADGNKKQTFEEKWRPITESDGNYYGECGDCIYTYIKKNTEVKIIGFCLDVKNIRIPDMIDGKKVTKIDLVSHPSGQEYSVQSVRLPRYFETIKKYHFLERHIIPNLKEIQVSPQNNSFKAKDGVLFTKNGKKLLMFPCQKKAAKYTVPRGVTRIANRAFVRTKNLKEVSLPGSVKSIGEHAFQSSALQKINLPKGLKTIEDCAFMGSRLVEITIPSKVREIPGDCFHNCRKLKKVTICSGVEKIGGSDTFYNCKKLRKMIIPPSVTEIHKEAFSSYVKLKFTIYAKKKSYAYRKGKKLKKYGIKVKAL